MAILQALLEPLALSASGYQRMTNGWAAASGGTGTGQARHHRLGQSGGM